MYRRRGFYDMLVVEYECPLYKSIRNRRCPSCVACHRLYSVSPPWLFISESF